MEGTQFYGLFGMILSLYRQNKFPGIGQMFRYTLRDESNHIEVFRQPASWTSSRRTARSGPPSSRRSCASLMREAVALEKEFIRDCLPVNAVGLSRRRVPDLHRLHRRPPPRGLRPRAAARPASKNPLPWLAEMMDIKKEQNFFEGRVTEYQKASALAVASDDEL